MRRLVTFMACVTLLCGCVSQRTRSHYPSGWNMMESSQIQKQCGIWQDSTLTELETREHVSDLVSSGVLTQDQGSRVLAHEVRVGDPECMAYAAYGASKAKETFINDVHKNLMILEWDYTCQHSPVSCPGLAVIIADGRVSSIHPLPPTNDGNTVPVFPAPGSNGSF